MENIEISEQLRHVSKRNWFKFGAESYLYKSDNNSIYKIFKTDKNEILENKLAKLQKLNDLGIEFFINPIATISCKGQFIGYKMNYDENDMQWFNTFLTLEEKKKYLKILKEELLILEEYGILYPDIKDDNLLINRKTGKLKFCDIDNVQIDVLKVDSTQYISRILQNKDNLFDTSIHAFMHNIYAIEELEGIQIYDFDSLIELESIKRFKSFNQKQTEILNNMILVKKNKIRNSYLIDNLN